jgi:catechol 2,3-dioxygenase-like lactoylglutathione lyase family enzyme
MNADDIYVMPAFVTLTVRDLQESADWYGDVLGFFILFELPGRLVHLRREKYQDPLLTPAAGIDADFAGPAGRGVSLCFSVGAPADVDRLAAQAASHRASILEGPINRPWNVRELVLSDPDGYRIILNGGPVEEKRFEEVFSTS